MSQRGSFDVQLTSGKSGSHPPWLGSAGSRGPDFYHSRKQVDLLLVSRGQSAERSLGVTYLHIHCPGKRG